MPFFTVANTISPHAAAGRRFKRPLMPPTAIMYKFLAPGIIKRYWIEKSLKNFKVRVFFQKIVRPMGNPAHDIHNRAIKSGTDGSMTFTLAYTLTKARIEKSEASASIRGHFWEFTK